MKALLFDKFKNICISTILWTRNTNRFTICVHSRVLSPLVEGSHPALLTRLQQLFSHSNLYVYRTVSGSTSPYS